MCECRVLQSQIIGRWGVCVDCVHRVGCVLVVMLRFGAAVWCGAGMFGGLGWRRAS